MPWFCDGTKGVKQQHSGGVCWWATLFVEKVSYHRVCGISDWKSSKAKLQPNQNMFCSLTPRRWINWWHAAVPPLTSNIVSLSLGGRIKWLNRAKLPPGCSLCSLLQELAASEQISLAVFWQNLLSGNLVGFDPVCPTPLLQVFDLQFFSFDIPVCG